MRTKRTQHEEAAWCRMGERHGAALLAAAAGRREMCLRHGAAVLAAAAGRRMGERHGAALRAAAAGRREMCLRHGAALQAAAAGRLFCCHPPASFSCLLLPSSPFSTPSPLTLRTSPFSAPVFFSPFHPPEGIFLFQIVQQPWHPWTNLTSCASSSATRWMRSRTWQRPQRAFISGKPFFPSTPPSPTAKSQRLPSTPRGTS